MTFFVNLLWKVKHIICNLKFCCISHFTLVVIRDIKEKAKEVSRQRHWPILSCTRTSVLLRGDIAPTYKHTRTKWTISGKLRTLRQVTIIGVRGKDNMKARLDWKSSIGLWVTIIRRMST